MSANVTAISGKKQKKKMSNPDENLLDDERLWFCLHNKAYAMNCRKCELDED